MENCPSHENDAMASVLVSHLTSSPSIVHRVPEALNLLPLVASMLVKTVAHKGEKKVDLDGRISGALYTMVNISSLVLHSAHRDSVCEAIFEMPQLVLDVLSVAVKPEQQDLYIYYALGVLANLMHTSDMKNVLQIVEAPGLVDVLVKNIQESSDVLEHPSEYLLANICAKGPNAIQKVIDCGIMGVLKTKDLYAPKQQFDHLHSKVYCSFLNMLLNCSDEQFDYCIDNQFVELVMSDFHNNSVGGLLAARVKSVWDTLVAIEENLKSRDKRKAFKTAFDKFEARDKMSEWVPPNDIKKLTEALEE
jgi:hypothetical protein